MIGILGGTFDPIHFGHLRCALEVQQQLGLQEVRLVPCRIPPHREKPVASVKQRVEMLKLAIAGQSRLVLDERELTREGPSYMADTLMSMRNEFGEQPLCMIIGMDAFKGLGSWHRWRELTNYAHIVIMTRPGSVVPSEGELGQFIVDRKLDDLQQLFQKPAGSVFFCEVTALGISSSAIRLQLARGESPEFLLPGQVLELIEDESVYQQ